MVEPERRTILATCVLAPNPSAMTLDGTNTYVVRAPGVADAVVVDPGPEIHEHLDLVESLGPVGLILLTHHHSDHAESIATIAARTGAVVRAADASLCIGGPPLGDREEIIAGGTRIVAIATPGHTVDSMCFQLPDDGAIGSGALIGSILTGDTILGRGTTILAQHDGAVRDYLASLETLRRLRGAELVLPAHGPALPSLSRITDTYLAHRRLRLQQIVDALDRLGLEPSQNRDTVARVTDLVYPTIDPNIRFAAEASTRAQLDYLAMTP